MNEPLRVLLVDDHILFRKGVQAVLAAREDMEAVSYTHLTLPTNREV